MPTGSRRIGVDPYFHYAWKGRTGFSFVVRPSVSGEGAGGLVHRHSVCRVDGHTKSGQVPFREAGQGGDDFLERGMTASVMKGV